MAIRYAVATGNWSSTATWDGGTLPTAADDVYSNNFVVTIDISPTVLSLGNGATTGVVAGGNFAPTNGITITCTGSGITGSLTGTPNAVILSTLTTGQSFTVVSNVTGGGNNANNQGIRHTGAGTINIIGNITGGSTQAPVGLLITAGLANITGNCTGGPSGTANTHGVSVTSSGSVNITGNVTGGFASTSHGVVNGGTGTVQVIGTALGGAASTASGISNNSSGQVFHTGAAQASSNAPAIAFGLTSQVTVLSGPFLTTANGINPVAAIRWFWLNTSPPATYYQIRTANLATIRPLYTADSVGGNPSVTDVRSGTVYGPAGELTGTCAVPGAASVLSGVPVDNTTGTATISAADIRAAVGLASANLDSQFAAIPAAPSAAAIRTEMDSNSTKLANLDATISSRSTYAGADTSGTTTLLGRLTSGRASNLDNLDTTISSRLSSSSYQAPLDAAGTRSAVGLASSNLDTQLSGISSGVGSLPSAATIASAVWSAAARTLTTAIDNSATIASAVWGYASGRTITGGTVDTLTNAPSVPSAATIAAAVWNSLTSSYSTNGTFGKQVLIGSTAQREVAVTGSHHVAADIHELQPAVIDATHFAAGALDSVRTSIGLASANLDAQLNALPTAAENATATRTELTPELERVANCATTQEVGDIVEGAVDSP